MKYLIALLTAATGLLHILIGFNVIGGGAGTNWLLVLNGAGYLVLLVLFWMASGNGGMIRWILLIYTLITLVGYFFLFPDPFGNTVALVIKAIELLLAIMLLLYKGPERVSVQAPSMTATTRGYPGIDATRTTAAEVDTTVSSMASSAAAGVSTAAAGAAAGALATADRAGETAAGVVEDTGDVVEEAFDETATFAEEVVAAAGDTVEAVGDVVEDAADSVGEAAGEAVDYVGDKAEAAYDATVDVAEEAAETGGEVVDSVGEAAGEAVDYVGDKAEAAYDATADVVADAGEAVGEVVDDTGDALRGGALAVGAAAGAAVESAEEMMGASAAELDAAQMAAEPAEDDLRAELTQYFHSLGSNTEFSKAIEYIEGIGAVYGQKLRAIGINTIMDLMVNGATRRGRKTISDQSGISQSLILTWVNHVDLYRIKGVAQEYADLLEESGVDTVVELAQRNPTNLHKRMVEVNEQKALVRRLPHASEVQSWVEQAKSLRRVIYY